MAKSQETSAQAFEIGAVVQLRSGGPLSCVTFCGSTSVNLIYWNNNTGLYETWSTHPACLKFANGAPQAMSSFSKGL